MTPPSTHTPLPGAPGQGQHPGHGRGRDRPEGREPAGGSGSPTSPTGHKPSSVSPNLCSNSRAKSGMQPQLNKICIPESCYFFKQSVVSGTFWLFWNVSIFRFIILLIGNPKISAIILINLNHCRDPLYGKRHLLRPFSKHKQKSSACSINPWTDTKILSSLELYRSSNKNLLQKTKWCLVSPMLPCSNIITNVYWNEA